MNFNSADKQVWEALHKLNAVEMKPLLTFLHNLADHTKDQLIAAEGVQLHRLQGKAGFLKDFLEAVKNAASVLEKMR